MSTLLKEYDTSLDTRRRLTVRGMRNFTHYHVKVFADGKIELEPRVLASLDQLSAKTLQSMDVAMRNYVKGVVGKPVDLKKLKRHMDHAE